MFEFFCVERIFCEFYLDPFGIYNYDLLFSMYYFGESLDGILIIGYGPMLVGVYNYEPCIGGNLFYKFKVICLDFSSLELVCFGIDSARLESISTLCTIFMSSKPLLYF